MKKILLVAIFGVILLSSCEKENSDNVNQDSIYTTYELFYNRTTDITTAKAIFSFGGPTGTLLKLDEPANCTFNGDELLYNTLGTHNKEFAGFTTSGIFTYIDLNGSSYHNSTPTMRTADFQAIDTINSIGAYTFVWNGSPLVTGETITLTIDGTQQGNLEVFSTSLNGATEIVLSAAKLQNLGVGDATFTLQRFYNQATVDQAPSKGGRMAMWYTTNDTIYIK